MSNTDTGPGSPGRLRRVRRIRWFIFVGMPVLLLIFITFTVVLAIRGARLHRELMQAREELNDFLEVQSEWEYSRLKATEESTGADKQSAGPSNDIEAAEADGKTAGVENGASGYTAGSESGSDDTGPAPLSQDEVSSLTLGNEELFDGYRKIYLTFDDGPSVNTASILDILARYDVKATFFVIRKDGANNEKLYRRIVDEGHTLGMHSNTHEYSKVYASREAFMEDTSSLRDFLYMVTGVESDFYRFPGGSSNRVSRIPMEDFARLLHENGIEYYDWNVSARDAMNPIPDADQVYQNVRSGLTGHDEAIILFHDTASKVSTVQALPRIIEYIQSLDDTVILPITETTNPIQHLTVHENN